MVEKKIHVHFIGINGSGISGVACIAKNMGFDVSGCDLGAVGDYTKQLINNGIEVSVGHNVEHIKNADIVVMSPALLYNDKYKTIEETRVAVETKTTMKWQKFLGEYIMHRKNIIAVSGTHGKTTTTTLIGLLCERAGFDPTVFVGGIVKEWNQTYRIGKSDYYVCEADEYDGNFLNYNPKYVILNNLEMEHPERFKDFDEYKQNFRNFLTTIQSDGKLVFYYDDENVLEMILSLLQFFREKNIELIGYTFNSDLQQAHENIKIVKLINEKNRIKINGEIIEYKLIGEFNAKNISIATVMALKLGIRIEIIKDVVKNFSGSKRRVDLLFSNDRIKLYDDYAHQHTQVKCTLGAIRENLRDNEEIIAILEPHLISRIKNNTEEYKKALLIADYPIVTKIFKSRESFMDDIDVVKLLNNRNIDYIENYDDVITKVKNIIELNRDKKFSIVVMGAGNSYKISNSLLEMLKHLFAF